MTDNPIAMLLLGLLVGGGIAAWFATQLAAAKKDVAEREARLAEMKSEKAQASTAQATLIAEAKAETQRQANGYEARLAEAKREHDELSILLTTALQAKGKAEAAASAANATQSSLQEQLADARTKLAGQDAELTTLRRERAQLATQREEIEKQLRELQTFSAEAQQQFKETFAALAGETLKTTTTQLLEQAEEKFEQVQKRAVAQYGGETEKLSGLLKPVKDTLDKLEAQTKELEEKRVGAVTRVEKSLEDVSRAHLELSQETRKLSDALQSSKARGRWGEIALQRILELAGLSENVDFFTQESQVTEDGDRLRPDCIVRLPGDRAVIIDAKVPFQGYYDAHEATTEAERHAAMERHSDAVAKHVKALNTRDYQKQLAEAPDFVVMFVPNDTFLAAAVEHRPELLDSALAQRVMIVTPASLLALLHTVALGWRQHDAAQNTREIQVLGEELCDRLGTFVEHLDKLNRQIEGLQDTYRKAVGSFERRVLATARKFEPLGIQTKKELTLAMEGVSMQGTDEPKALVETTIEPPTVVN